MFCAFLGNTGRVVFSDASCMEDMYGNERTTQAVEIAFDVMVEMSIYPHVPSAVHIRQDVHTDSDSVTDALVIIFFRVQTIFIVRIRKGRRILQKVQFSRLRKS